MLLWAGIRVRKTKLYISVAVTLKMEAREPLGFSSRYASILALIVLPASAVSMVLPFCGAPSLGSVKRSREPSRQVMVISHIAIGAKCRRFGHGLGEEAASGHHAGFGPQ